MVCLHIGDTIDTKLLNTKGTKDLKTGPKNACVINFKNKSFDNIYTSCEFCCQDLILKIPEPLQTNVNNHVPSRKLARII